MGHENRAHAKLSASGASRWLACPGSVDLEAGFADTTSDFAREGTLAHELADVILNYEVGKILADGDKGTLRALEDSRTDSNIKIANNPLYYEGMVDDVLPYTTRVLDHWLKAREADPLTVIELESRVSWEHIYEGGFGTNDASIFSNGVLDVFDLKFGRGVVVSAENNPQGMLYAEGVRKKYEVLDTVDIINIHIIQPRLNNFSTWSITPAELDEWLAKTVAPTAELIFEGTEKTKPGDHCKFCKAKARCRALADDMVKAETFNFTAPGLLTAAEVEDMHERSAKLADWANSVSEFMLTQALDGFKWDNYKVVAGRASRVIVNSAEAEEVLRRRKFRKSDFTETKLVGLAKLDKLVGGKEKLSAMLGDNLVMREGKPTLAHKSDKRPDLMDSASQDFAEFLTNTK